MNQKIIHFDTTTKENMKQCNQDCQEIFEHQ